MCSAQVCFGFKRKKESADKSLINSAVVMRKRKFKNKEADLDITSFMNLMIILVPVLLMSMVFSQTSILELKLPDLASNATPDKDEEKKLLELVINADDMVINYPAGAPVKRIPKKLDPETNELDYDYTFLSEFLQQLKRSLKDSGIEKKDIFILSQQETDYQTIVKSMDTVRSYKAVLVASVVDAELFPVISLGDAPPSQGSSVSEISGKGGAK